MSHKYLSQLTDEERDIKTENQWLKLGFVPKSKTLGKLIYPNRYYRSPLWYYSSHDVRPMTDEELNQYKEKIRSQQKVKSQKRKKEKRRRQRQQDVYRLCDQQAQVAETILKEMQTPLTREIVIDLETTGLDPFEDEILQIAVLDANSGEILLDTLVQPYFKEDWYAARMIHGITPNQAKKAPYIFEVLPELNRILADTKTIIGYNILQFDCVFMDIFGAVFPPDAEFEDVMPLFAKIYGEWSEKHSDYKFQSLSTCAKYYGYNWGSDTAHNALADCKATAFCYKKILETNF